MGPAVQNMILASIDDNNTLRPKKKNWAVFKTFVKSSEIGLPVVENAAQIGFVKVML